MHQDEASIDTLTVGEQLSHARAAMQLSIEDIAQHLKLSPLQITRLENNDFATLGAVFSRGFVRLYARHVGLNADELVAAMAGNLHRNKESLSVHNEEIPLGKGLSKYWLILFVMAIILVLGVPLAIYYWLSSSATITPASKPPVIVPHPVAPAVNKVLAPTALPPAAPAAEKKDATTENDTAVEPVTDANTGRMSFKFDADSWVEIRDGSNHTVLSHLYRAGETAEISGTPPLSLVIGNAAQVSLQYNDQPVDLKPYTGVTVAKVTLK
ncbi:helix-turn-helix domain-containing protein [Sulfuriferula nivalis]|uniref:Membrane protein n=1 Tax=Sulfuriferula nivalis TaxID=2675298 RepID=A0A809S481_9PROT|nr:RodZ domain-containing protein [Sulfuriferula nivalis]BBP01708.1 membrane protein [Sulfuriferula nivalis]